MKIWANMLVRNEEHYVWFAVMSVINHVDKILIFDDASTDKTYKIISLIKKKYPEKLIIKRLKKGSTPENYPNIRQRMLEKTNAEWIFLVDADEIWWDETAKKITDLTRNSDNKLETIVSSYRNLIGDIYHYQEEAAGRYKIDKRKGHLTIRMMKKSIPGLHVDRPHGQQGFFDYKNRLIQERSSKFRLHLEEVSYLHMTHLGRSDDKFGDRKVPKRKKKLKKEIGSRLPKDYYYPEVFFRPRPSIVPSPWINMKSGFKSKAYLLTIPRKIKRRIYEGKTGY